MTTLGQRLKGEGGNEDVIIHAGGSKRILYALSPRVVIIDNVREPKAVDTADDEQITDSVLALPGPQDVKETAPAENTEAGDAELMNPGKEFANLVSVYGKLNAKYRGTVREKRKRTDVFLADILEETGADIASLQSMLVLARLSDTLGRPYGPDRSTEPISLSDHMQIVYDEMDDLLRGTDLSLESDTRPENSAKARLIMFGLHMGLPPSLSVLSRQAIKKGEKVGGGRATYAELHDWTTVPVRSTEFASLAIALGYDPKLIERNFTIAANILKRTLPALERG